MREGSKKRGGEGGGGRQESFEFTWQLAFSLGTAIQSARAKGASGSGGGGTIQGCYRLGRQSEPGSPRRDQTRRGGRTDAVAVASQVVGCFVVCLLFLTELLALIF